MRIGGRGVSEGTGVGVGAGTGAGTTSAKYFFSGLKFPPRFSKAVWGPIFGGMLWLLYMWL